MITTLQKEVKTINFLFQLTSHLEEMLRAAFAKFNAWQARRLAKGKS